MPAKPMIHAAIAKSNYQKIPGDSLFEPLFQKNCFMEKRGAYVQLFTCLVSVD